MNKTLVLSDMMRVIPIGHQFYDQGWNNCIDGLPYDSRATLDYRYGWLDCSTAPEKDKVKI